MADRARRMQRLGDGRVGRGRHHRIRGIAAYRSITQSPTIKAATHADGNAGSPPAARPDCARTRLHSSEVSQAVGPSWPVRCLALISSLRRRMSSSDRRLTPVADPALRTLALL